jgi:hypothetical protein
MFTTGSKYFLGLTALASITTVIYMVVVTPNDLGALAIGAVAVAFGLLGGITIMNRDGDVDTADEAGGAAALAPSRSVWPIVMAFGAAVMFLGLATYPVIFILGIATLIVAGVEWMIRSWSDRASEDSSFNRFVRERAIGSIEYPALAGVGIAVIAFSFSRIMLAVSKEGGPFIFIIVASGILLVGCLAAFKPSFRGRVVWTIATIGAVGVIAAGASSGLIGERHELAVASAEDHYSQKECEATASDHFDKHAENKVSLKSAVLATITVKDGKVTAQLIGLPQSVATITIARSNPTNILFRNLDGEEHRLVANLGTKQVTPDVTEQVVDCTQLVGKGQEQVLTLTISKPSIANGPYKFEVPGIPGSDIEVVVP